MSRERLWFGMSPLEVQLRAQVVAQATAIAEREQRIASLAAKTSTQAERIAQLEHQVRLLQRALYGPKSERLMDRGQQLELEELLAQLTSELAEATPPPPLPEPRETRRKITPHGRALIPDHLPRVEVLIDLPEQDKVCLETGAPLVRIGEERSEKLAYQPASYYVKVFVRPKYASADAPEAGVAIAPLPPELLPRCKADASLLAQVLVDNRA